MDTISAVLCVILTGNDESIDMASVVEFCSVTDTIGSVSTVLFTRCSTSISILFDATGAAAAAGAGCAVFGNGAGDCGADDLAGDCGTEAFAGDCGTEAFVGDFAADTFAGDCGIAAIFGADAVAGGGGAVLAGDGRSLEAVIGSE